MNERVVIDQRSSCRDRHVTHITNLTPLNQRTNSYIKAASVAHLGRLFFTVNIWTSALTQWTTCLSASVQHLWLKSSIAGLQVTTVRPCWWSRERAFLSSGNFEKKNYTVLNASMAALSSGCKPSINIRIPSHVRPRMYRLCKEFTHSLKLDSLPLVSI